MESHGITETSFVLHVDERGNRAHVRLTGRLPASEAYVLRDRIAGLREPAEVDLSGLDECSDLALEVLALWFQERGHHDVRFVGVPAAGERVLAAIGINAEGRPLR